MRTKASLLTITQRRGASFFNKSWITYDASPRVWVTLWGSNSLLSSNGHPDQIITNYPTEMRPSNNTNHNNLVIMVYGHLLHKMTHILYISAAINICDQIEYQMTFDSNSKMFWIPFCFLFIFYLLIFF